MNYPLPTIETVNETFRERVANPDGMLGALYLPYMDSRHPGNEVRWAVYKESSGITYAHIYGADPRVIDKTPTATFKVEGQPYKEIDRIGEKEVLLAARLDDRRQRERLIDMIGESLIVLDERSQRRMEKDRWQVLNTGKLEVSEDGIARTIDYGIPVGNFLSVGSGVTTTWTDPINATPLDDFAALEALFDDVDHDGIHINMNKATARLLLACEQITDKLAGLMTSLEWNLSNFPELFGRMIGPDFTVHVYNGGYLPEGGGSRVRYIPDYKVNAVARPVTVTSEGNAAVGKFVGVDNPHTNGLDDPQPGRFAVPNYDNAKRESPNPHIDIVGGVYGLAVLQRPGHVANMDVSDPG